MIDTATTWKNIFVFPRSLALIVYPSAAAIPRNPVTANSLAMIRIAIHPGIIRTCTSEINAAEISSLSAIGSSNVPTVVTCFQRRARYPSSKSVIAAEYGQAMYNLGNALAGTPGGHDEGERLKTEGAAMMDRAAVLDRYDSLKP